ncbi:MAG: hypothetical protein IKG27_02100 [Bacilli bacterium]|nr:hypothetical protein [Bacilli bacterium]
MLWDALYEISDYLKQKKFAIDKKKSLNKKGLILDNYYLISVVRGENTEFFLVEGEVFVSGNSVMFFKDDNLEHYILVNDGTLHIEHINKSRAKVLSKDESIKKFLNNKKDS